MSAIFDRVNDPESMIIIGWGRGELLRKRQWILARAEKSDLHEIKSRRCTIKLRGVKFSLSGTRDLRI